MVYESFVQDSYATGVVTGGTSAHLGGLVGDIFGAGIASSYSVGAVEGGTDRTRGGLVGKINLSEFTTNFWDINTSGEDAHHGYGTCKGNNRNCRRNITGLTTSQFLSNLPAGFDPNIWGEKKNINGGYPYLLALPQK